MTTKNEDPKTQSCGCTTSPSTPQPAPCACGERCRCGDRCTCAGCTHKKA